MVTESAQLGASQRMILVQTLAASKWPRLIAALLLLSSSFGCHALEKVHTQTHTVSKELHSKPSRVIELTSRNFGQVFWSRNAWLIEFYSPNCVHCTEFADAYQDIARQLHPNVSTGRVNGEVERALVQRFSIQAYPSFYIVDGFSVYQFTQPRTKQTVIDFTRNYKQSSALPILVSPMGPLGLLQGGLVSSGLILSDILESGQSRGWSPVIVGAALFGSLFLTLFLVIVCLAVSIPARPKQD